MPGKPFSQRLRADIVFRERLPSEEAFDSVQFQMPNAMARLIEAEARRQGTDFNSLMGSSSPDSRAAMAVTSAGRRRPAPAG
jgi:hypothetical protein